MCSKTEVKKLSEDGRIIKAVWKVIKVAEMQSRKKIHKTFTKIIGSAT
jgi:hypothetical protein